MGKGTAYTWPTVSTATFYRRKSGWRQKPPYVVAPYQLDVVRSVTSVGYKDGPPAPSRFNYPMVSGFPGFSRAQTDAVNKAYASFLDSVSSRAQLASNFAEMNQSYEMLRNRALQLARFTRYVRQKRFRAAATELGMAVAPRGVSIKKSMGNNWLEYWFGWKPLIQDIYSACDHLQQPIKTHHAVGRGFNAWALRYDAPKYSPSWQHERFIGVRTYSDVAVANPNLWLANNLGLINPVSVMWELVPFSFVVDWFLNIGQVISSVTDLYGLKLANSGTTIFVRGTSKEWWVDYGARADYDATYVKRAVGITLPTLTLKPWRAPSKARAATAVSLLLQQLQ